MKRLFKHLTVVDSNSKWNGKQIDILTQDDQILEIKKNIPTGNHEVIDLGKICVSVGWMDIGTQIGEPGFEQRESIESASLAAKKGGFTGLAVFPNTHPVLQSKSEIQFIKKQAENSLVEIYPIGALSKDCEGKDLTEMIDMQNSGAIAFSDGRKSIENAGLLLRALEYSKRTGNPIIHHPALKSLHFEGMMHEGKWSTQLGTVGIPSISEELCLIRDISLNEYAEAKLISHLITTKESIEVLKKQKKRQSNLGATVGYLHLIAEDSALEHFDVMYKIQPPLRGARDRKALIKALIDGNLDAICSHHEPIEEEIKDLEFSYAEFGAIGLQTCFPALNTYLKDNIPLEIIIEKLTSGPRVLLQLAQLSIEEGQVANFTLFDPNYEWTFSQAMVASKSKNSPFIDSNFKGAVKGVFNQGQIWINPDFTS